MYVCISMGVCEWGGGESVTAIGASEWGGGGEVLNFTQWPFDRLRYETIVAPDSGHSPGLGWRLPTQGPLPPWPGASPGSDPVQRLLSSAKANDHHNRSMPYPPVFPPVRKCESSFLVLFSFPCPIFLNFMFVHIDNFENIRHKKVIL